MKRLESIQSAKRWNGRISVRPFFRRFLRVPRLFSVVFPSPRLSSSSFLDGQTDRQAGILLLRLHSECFTSRHVGVVALVPGPSRMHKVWPVRSFALQLKYSPDVLPCVVLRFETRWKTARVDRGLDRDEIQVVRNLNRGGGGQSSEREVLQTVGTPAKPSRNPIYLYIGASVAAVVHSSTASSKSWYRPWRCYARIGYHALSVFGVLCIGCLSTSLLWLCLLWPLSSPPPPTPPLPLLLVIYPRKTQQSRRLAKDSAVLRARRQVLFTNWPSDLRS